MIKLKEIKYEGDYKLRLRFSDGTIGTTDLSDIVGIGVFDEIKDKKLFASAYVSKQGSLAWNEDLELCADSLYLRVTDTKVEDMMPKTKNIVLDA